MVSGSFGDVRLFAHSMGNIVAGEALRNLGSGITVSHYVMTQAAVPAHCYDPRTDLDYDVFTTYDANHPTPDSYRSYFGATSIGFALQAPAINFYNPNDTVLAEKWRGNELGFKPDTLFGYSYDGTTSWRYRPPNFNYEVTDPYERMAFVARPRSRAAGVEGNTAGAVGPKLDLSAQPLEFGDEHSPQFNRSFIATRHYYEQLLFWLGL